MYRHTTRTHLAKDTKKTALRLVQFGLDWLKNVYADEFCLHTREKARKIALR